MRKKRIRPHRRRLRTAAILTLSFVIIAGCSETIPSKPNRSAAGQEQTLRSVKVTKISKQKIGDPLEHAANVQSSIQFEIIAKAGGDIEKILKYRGDVVQAGEVILTLNSKEANFERDKAALAFETVQNGIKRARERAVKDQESQKRELANSIMKMEQTLLDLTRTYNKTKNDYEVGKATKAQLYQAQVQLQTARLDLDLLKQKPSPPNPAESIADMEIQLKNAQLTLQQLEQTMSYLEVKAPASGILTEMPFEVGMTLQPGAKAGLIQKLDPIKIKAQLTEAETNYVRGKTELSYYLPGTTQKYQGRISFLSKVMDPESKAYEINLEVPNADMALKPGMKLWIQLTNEQEQTVLTVPSYSIVKEGDDAFAFVLVGDSVEKRKVQLGRLNEPNQEVLSGASEGEQVVISNPNQLRDKEKVQRTAD